MAPTTILPSFVSRSLTNGLDLARNTLGGLTWGPALAVAKPAILSIFSQIETGTLLLVDEPAAMRMVYGESIGGGNNNNNSNNNNNKTAAIDTPKLNGGCGPKYGPRRPRADDKPVVELVVHDDAFWLRLLLFADMGFAESYMLGEFSCTDLPTFFRLFLVNRDRMGNGTTAFASVSGAVARLARTTNTLSNALLNISAHYDISNDMFAAFLSDDMTYSCAVWGGEPDKLKKKKAKTVLAGKEREWSSSDDVGMRDEGEGHQEENNDSSTCDGDSVSDGGESLEAAQLTKLLRFIDGAHIQPSDHVLEIGTGWGSFAIEAVKRVPGCRVTSVTLSREQKVLAEQRIRDAGPEVASQIEVLLMDYRKLPGPHERGGRAYDKIVSIEMLEAVGQEYLSTYFAMVNRLLKREGGIAMFQCITMPEGRHEAYSKSEDFINKYIFPGGYLPSTMQLLNHISTESAGTLIVERVENIGGHYARTLRLWREKFLRNFESHIRPALLSESSGGTGQKKMTKDEVDVFRRKWEYYFAYCEAGFVTKTLGDVIITVGREGALELMEDVPL